MRFRTKACDAYKVKLFWLSQNCFENLIKNDYNCNYQHLIDAVICGVFNPNKSIIENVKEFVDNATLEMKKVKEFYIGIDRFNEILTKLDLETKEKFYNCRLIDYILEQHLCAYQQVDIARMYFTNPNASENEKKDYLHYLISKIINGSKDYRILNSLDKVNINPEFFKKDEFYQEFMECLVRFYVNGYDKHNKDDLIDNVIRMIYRHQNRGFYTPSDDSRNIIMYTYAYNCWFKNLKLMIEKNNIGITKDNCMVLSKLMFSALEDLKSKYDLTRGEYISLYDKFIEITSLISMVAEDNLKLTREEL